MKILLADDETELLYPTAKFLEHKGFIVDTASDGKQSLELIEKNIYDCIILDIMMPYADGIAVLSTMRKSGNTTPTILLTAKNTSVDRIEGYDGGADDYISKPVALAELASRVQAVIRRNTNYHTEILSYGNITYNKRTYELCGPGSSIILSGNEGFILQELISHHGKIIEEEFIIDKFRQINEPADTKTISLYVVFLQKKLNSIKADISVSYATGSGYHIEITDTF